MENIIIKLKENPSGLKQVKAENTGYDLAIGYDMSERITGLSLEKGGAELEKYMIGFHLRGFGLGCTYYLRD